MTQTSEMLIADLRNLRFSNNTGSISIEIYVCVVLPILFNFFAIFIVNSFFQTAQINHFLNLFIFEFVCCILPLVFSLTILSDFVYEIFFLSTIVLILLIAAARLKAKYSWKTVIQGVYFENSKLSCVSHFRGVVNLYSVVCILCADFNCFPKRFLKTEFYGYGLMDTGVGLFVVVLSLASSHLERKRTFLSVFIKSFTLLIIGIGRFLMVRSTDYHHQIFEYGVHWNFFITLAILTIFNEVLFLVLKSVKSTVLFSFSLIIFYEFMLSAGLKDWIFDPSPRLTFISANREGICSLAGYEVLYLWGVVIRNYLPAKGYSYYKYARTLLMYICTFIISLFATVISDRYFGVSRRCANSGYVIWIISITLICLIVIISLELGVLVLNNKSKPRVNYSIPVIIDSVNFNGLSFFLLGNFLTGLINLNVNTLKMDDFWSVVIIMLYIFCCCCVTVFLRSKNWRIR